MKKSNSIFAALFSSLGICFIGAVCWGCLYSLGLFSALISFVTVALACLVYSHYRKINALFFVWTAFWIITLNLFAMLFADTFHLYLSYNKSFIDCFKLLLEFTSTEPAVKTAFISNMVWSIVFVIIGFLCSIGIIKKQNAKHRDNQQFETNNITTSKIETKQPSKKKALTNNKHFNLLVEDAKSILNKFNQTKDAQILKDDLKFFNDQKIKPLKPKDKETFKKLSTEIISASSSAKADINACKTILKFL